MRLHLVVAASLAVSVAACTNDLPPRPEPPVLTVTSPDRGLIHEGLGSVQMRGTVAPGPDGSPVTEVKINGQPATVAADGSWSALVPLRAGANRLDTLATAANGGSADDTRGVLAGHFVAADTMVENALSAALSKEAFSTLATRAEELVATADLGALVMPMNPVVAKGLSNGQEDCLYGKASVRPGLDLSTADIAIVPGDAGLALDVSLHDLYIPLHARYAAACLDGDTDITIRATTARVRGTIAVTVANGRFDVKLLSPTVTLVGFDLRASGVPGAVISLLDLDHTIGGVLANAVEKFVGPMVEETIAGVHVGPQTVALLGKNLTVQVAAASIGFDAAGAEIALDSKITVGGGERAFYFTDDQVPPMRGDDGFQLAIADDTVNQLLSGFWAAGGLDLTITRDLGNYDAIRLEALLPPVVTTTAEGGLHIAMPDLIAHLTNRGDEITTVALSVDLGLKVTPNAGNPNIAQLTIEPPVIQADVLFDRSGIPGAGLEDLMPFLIQHELDTFAPLLAAVPLPAVAGLRFSDLTIGSVGSYLTISGSIR